MALDSRFNEATRFIIQNYEGGFIEHKIKDDPGGLTYAGIARRKWPDWPGWSLSGEERDRAVFEFYERFFWAPMFGDKLHFPMAFLMYDCAINQGLKTSVMIAQAVAGASVDGIIGGKTISAINAQCEGGREERSYTPENFALPFTLMRIRRYLDIVRKREKSRKFLVGWLNRTYAVLEKSAELVNDETGRV